MVFSVPTFEALSDVMALLERGKSDRAEQFPSAGTTRKNLDDAKSLDTSIHGELDFFGALSQYARDRAATNETAMKVLTAEEGKGMNDPKFVSFPPKGDVAAKRKLLQPKARSGEAAVAAEVPCADVSDLMEIARHATKNFNALAKELVQAVNLDPKEVVKFEDKPLLLDVHDPKSVAKRFSEAPLKSEKRIHEKIKNEYKGVVAKLLDVVRCSVVVDTEEQLEKFASLLADPDSCSKTGNKAEIVRLKNRFNPRLFSGYGDCLYNVRVWVPDMDCWHVCELQLHCAPLLNHKTTTHKTYEYFRSYFSGNMQAADSRLALLDKMGAAILEVVKNKDTDEGGFKRLVEEVISQERAKGPPPEDERHTEMWASDRLRPLDELLQLANDPWVRNEGAVLVRTAMLEMEETAHGADAMEPANAANRLGIVLRLKGDLEEAKKHTSRALLQFEKDLPPNDRQIAAILNNLASLEAELLASEVAAVECENLYQRARKILADKGPDPREERHRKVYGEDAPEAERKGWRDEDQRSLSSTLSNLADLKRDEGAFDESIKLYGEALVIDLERLVRNPKLDKRQIAEDCSNIAASMIESVPDPEEGEELSEDRFKLQVPINIDEKELSSAPPEVRELIDSLKNAGARELLGKAIDIEGEIFGKDSYKIAIAKNNLGNLEQKLGKHLEAEKAYKEALELDMKYFGENHQNVATRLNNIATLLAAQQRYDEAAQKFAEALKIDEEVLGVDSMDVAQDLNNLATALGDAEKYAEAEPHFERAIKIAEDTFGKDHVEVAANMHNYAAMLHTMGTEDALDKAKPLFDRALEIRKSKLGEEDDATKNTQEYLDDWA